MKVYRIIGWEKTSPNAVTLHSIGSQPFDTFPKFTPVNSVHTLQIDSLAWKPNYLPKYKPRVRVKCCQQAVSLVSACGYDNEWCSLRAQNKNKHQFRWNQTRSYSDVVALDSFQMNKPKPRKTAFQLLLLWFKSRRCSPYQGPSFIRPRFPSKLLAPLYLKL